MRLSDCIAGAIAITIIVVAVMWGLQTATSKTNADDRAWCQSIEGTVYSAEGNCYKNGIKLKKGEE